MKYRTFKTSLSKMIGEIKDKGKTPEESIKALNRLYPDNDYEGSQMLAADTMELGYLNNNRKIIFLDKKTIKFLYDLKLPISYMKNISLTFDCFSISVDKDAEINGVKLSPFLACLTECLPNEYENLSNIIKLPIPCENPYLNSLEEKFLAISINSDAGESCIINVTKDEIKEVLNKKSIAGIEGDGQKTIYTYIKILMSLSLYNQITNNEYLQKGFPLGLATKPKLLDMTKSEHKKTQSFRFNIPIPVKTGKKSSHIRADHFRQLVNDKYYQGPYSHLKKGDRWVPVKGGFVGGGDPYTQEKGK